MVTSYLNISVCTNKHLNRDERFYIEKEREKHTPISPGKEAQMNVTNGMPTE